MRSILSVGCFLALSGCAIIVNGGGGDDVQVRSVFSGNAVVGDGRPAHDVRDVRDVRDARAVAGVSAIDVSGPLEVTVRVGPAASLEVEADSNLLPMIRTEVTGGVLRMWVEGSVRSANRVRVNYTAPSLTAVHASGSGNLAIIDLNGAALSFSKSGSGSVILSGRVSRLDFQHSGSGQVLAAALDTGDARVTLSGSGAMSLGHVTGATMVVSTRGSGSLAASGAVAALTAQANGSGGINLSGLACEQADLSTSGSGDITAQVKRALIARSSGSGRITVYGNPGQRNVSGKHVVVLN